MFSENQSVFVTMLLHIKLNYLSFLKHYNVSYRYQLSEDITNYLFDRKYLNDTVSDLQLGKHRLLILIHPPTVNCNNNNSVVYLGTHSVKQT